MANNLVCWVILGLTQILFSVFLCICLTQILGIGQTILVRWVSLGLTHFKTLFWETHFKTLFWETHIIRHFNTFKHILRHCFLCICLTQILGIGQTILVRWVSLGLTHFKTLFSVYLFSTNTV